MIPDYETPTLLTALDSGASARLHDAHLDDDTRSLLRSLGLTDECQLRVCQGGDPCVIQVRSTRIGMSRDVARRLWVVREGASDSRGSHAGHRSDR